MTEPPAGRLLTVDEAAAWLGISRRAVYAAITRDGLPSLTVGRCRRFRMEALAEWAQQREQDETAERDAWRVVRLRKANQRGGRHVAAPVMPPEGKDSWKSTGGTRTAAGTKR